MQLPVVVSQEREMHVDEGHSEALLSITKQYLRSVPFTACWQARDVQEAYTSMQPALWQAFSVSVEEQRGASPQNVHPGIGVFTQPEAVHESTVQALLSSQNDVGTGV